MMATVNAAKGGDVDAFNQLLDFSRNFSRADYLAGKGIMDAAAKTLALQNDAFLQGMTQVNDLITAAAQGSIAGKMTANDVKVDGKPVKGEKTPAKESWEPNYYVQTRPLSEGQVYMIIDRVLVEAGFMDKIKAGAGKVAGAAAKGAAWVGKQATEKVTSAKLLAAWKLEGSPTDSEEFKQFLLNYGGIDAPVVDKVFTDLKISAAPEAQAATGGYAEVKKAIAQLNTKDRTRMIAYLTKQLGTA